MEVFFQELKRQFNLKRLITYVLIATTLAGLWTWFIVGGATEDFMQTGCYEGYKGKAAIEAAAKDRQGTTGYMTEDKFQKGCEVLLESLKGKDVVMNKDLLKQTVYADLLVTQEFRLRNMKGQSTKDLLHIPKDAGKHFYENEDVYYQDYINKNAHNETEKALALSTWNSVKKPYIYFSGFKQWNEGIEHMMIFSFVLMIVAGVFTSSIIAKDKENEMDEIIKATINGRKNLTVAKVVIPWIMTVIIYLCGIGVYVVLLRHLLPLDALNTSIQVSSKSIFPYSMWQVLKKVFVFGGVGILTTTSFSTGISSIVKKTSRAIEFSIMTILASFLFGIFLNTEAPIIKVIKILIPGGTVFSYLQFVGLSEFPITTILGKNIWMPSILLMISGITFLLSTVFTVINYKRR